MVRESKAPHSIPTFCVKKPNGNKLNAATTPVQTPNPRKDNKLNATTIPTQTPIAGKDVLQDNMAGCTMYSASTWSMVIINCSCEQVISSLQLSVLQAVCFGSG